MKRNLSAKRHQGCIADIVKLVEDREPPIRTQTQSGFGIEAVVSDWLGFGAFANFHAAPLNVNREH